MGDFPTHPDQVTPAWLGKALDRPVESVGWTPIGTRQVGDTVRLSIAFADGGGTRKLAAKFPAVDPTSRATAAMFGLYRKEVLFYREAARHLKMRAPQVHYAEVCEDGAAFLLLFEDLGPARQGDQIASCSLADAQAAIRQAAAIHAPSCRHEILASDWLQPPTGQAEQLAAMYQRAHALFRERYRESLEPEFIKVCDALADQCQAYFSRSASPQCIVHGDFRLDNMMFDIKGGREPIAILDWQTVSAGNPMTDVAYFIGCGIGEGMWRSHEGDLLALYLDEMARRGVKLAREEIHEDYRRAVLHGVATAVFSAAFVQRTERGDANFLSMARGACSLALEHDSIAALRGEM